MDSLQVLQVVHMFRPPPAAHFLQVLFWCFLARRLGPSLVPALHV